MHTEVLSTQITTMENQKEDESGWQTADKRKSKKQRPSQTGPAPPAAVDDQKSKSLIFVLTRKV